MQGHVRKRGKGSWGYIADVGMAAAERCSGCGRRFWVERRPKGTCPKCGEKLVETEERRRQTKAGFPTGKEAQSALNNLRHTHATLALRAGIHPKVVSERLGHATISITLDTYSHAIAAMQEAAAVRIADLVSAAK